MVGAGAPLRSGRLSRVDLSGRDWPQEAIPGSPLRFRKANRFRPASPLSLRLCADSPPAQASPIGAAAAEARPRRIPTWPKHMRCWGSACAKVAACRGGEGVWLALRLRPDFARAGSTWLGLAAQGRTQAAAIELREAAAARIRRWRRWLPLPCSGSEHDKT